MVVTMPPAGARILVAMSGGIDSSVAAALLHRAGLEVVGVNRLHGFRQNPVLFIGK